MKQLKERIYNLLSIKSIITILITLLVVYLSIIGKIQTDLIVNIYLMIIGFYFGTQSKK